MQNSTDIRTKFDDAASDIQSKTPDAIDCSQGVARAISSFIVPSLSWQDIPYFKCITKMPMVLKGVQRIEDVLKAGCRPLHPRGPPTRHNPSAIEILAEVMPELRSRNVRDRIEVYIDGSVRRATDIIKALGLSPKGVSIGRPFLHAMNAYGEPGVVSAMQLLKDEFEVGMKLVSTKNVDELGPEMVDARGLGVHSVPTPADYLSADVYDRLAVPPFVIKSKL